MKRLIVIDDEYIVVEGIKAMINRLDIDYQVVAHADNGLDGLRLIQEYEPDLVITDIRMPGLDGLSLIENCKDDLPNTVFVIVSGYQEFEYARKALSLGVKDYIDKPITLGKLSRIFESLKKSEEDTGAPVEKENKKIKEFIGNLRGEDREVVLKSFGDLLSKYKKEASSFENYRGEVYKLTCVSIGIFFEQHRVIDIDRYFPSYKNLEMLKTYEETDEYARVILNRIIEKMDLLKLGNLHGTVIKLVEYIGANYNQNIGLNEFAYDVGMNPAYLSMLFKEEMGISFIKYLTKLRIDHAKKLLVDGGKVTDVSEAVGYQDYRYFSGIFKKNVGISPNEFRKQRVMPLEI